MRAGDRIELRYVDEQQWRPAVLELITDDGASLVVRESPAFLAEALLLVRVRDGYQDILHTREVELRFVREGTPVERAEFIATGPFAETLCQCGRPLHYNDKTVEAFVRRTISIMGEYLTVRNHEGRAFRVSRHYIAQHGLKGNEIAELGYFEEIIGREG